MRYKLGVARKDTVHILYGIMAVVLGMTVWQWIPEQAFADYSSPALPCDGSFYQIRTPGTSVNTSLYRLQLDTSGTYTEQEIGPLSQAFTGMNAMGYNPLDGYLYALASAANGGINFHLYRLNYSGVVTDVGLVSGLNADGGTSGMAGGTFGPDGTMYVIQTVAGQPIRLSKINLTTMTSTYVTLSKTIPQGDIAFDPISGALYAVEAGQNAPLHTIDTTTGAVSDIGSTSKINGSAFFDTAGNLYASGNPSGAIYIVNKTTGVYTQIATGAAATTTDGASCAFSPRSVDTIKSVSAVTHLSGSTYRVSYSFGIKNTSTSEIDENVQIVDKLDQTFSSGSPTITVTSGPSVSAGPCSPNASYDGTSNIALLSGTDDLAVGISCTVTLTVDLTYPNTAAVPTTAQNNVAYASTTSGTPNNGHYYVSDGQGGYVVVPPSGLQASDTSTNGTGFPSTANSDTPSVTPVSFSSTPLVQGYKSVHFTDLNANGTVNPGDKLTYTIAYRNTGSGDEANFQITDAIPTGTTYVPGSLTVTPSGSTQTGSASGSFNGGSATNLLASPVSLVYNGVLTASFSVTINAGYLGSLANQAVGDGDSIAPVLTDALDNSASGNCQAPSGITIPAGSVAQTCTAGSNDQTIAMVVANDPVVTVTKTDGVTTVHPGDSLTYTITINNTATDSTATNLVVSDTLPASVTFVSASDSGNNTAGVVSWNINSLAGGSSVTRTVTVTVNSNVADGTVLNNSATASSSSDPGLCSRSGSSCNGTDNNTIVDVPVNVFDPPSGYKTFDAAGLPVLHWKMVWINDANSSPERVKIVDPLNPSAPYVAGSLVCSARGVSTTTSCSYDANTHSVIWDGVIGADPGATDEASAANEVVLELNVSIPSAMNSLENQAKAYWDENGDGTLDASDNNVNNDTPVLTGNGTTLGSGQNQPTVFTRPAQSDSLANTGDSPLLYAIAGLCMCAIGAAVLFPRHESHPRTIR